MTEGFLKKMTSSQVHTRRLVAAQMLVLRTAMEESILAVYGSPPLNPAHPIHSNPAPANISSTLFGGNLSLSFVDLGPTCIIYKENLSPSHQLIYIFSSCHGRNFKNKTKIVYYNFYVHTLYYSWSTIKNIDPEL
jgi:hypothetical protein